jgi:hypothetical protein
MKPGSIASEAARLTLELGILVTPDKVKWWRRKNYPMNDTPALLKCIRNQERIAGDPAAVKALRQKACTGTEAAPDLDAESPALARRLITDRMIAEAKGSIPMSEVFDYLRDQWEAEEWHCPTRLANKSEAEIVEIVKRDVPWKFWTLAELMPSVSLPAFPEWLHSMVFPDNADESANSLQG